MDQLFKILLVFHITVGSLSLIVFWIPVFVKKGGDLHVKVGKVYVWLMWCVVISAIFMSAINLLNGHYIVGAFLGFLSVITAHPLWYAISILKYKKEVPSQVVLINQLLNLFLITAGAGLFIWSLLLKVEGEAILLMVFGLIGIFTAGPRLLRKEKSDTWMANHIEGMLGTGIAAYTAFFAFGGSRLLGHVFTEQLIIIPWILPTIIGVYGIKYYKRKFCRVKTSLDLNS